MRALREFLAILIRGFCMGAADVVPGVSGGTMAFILGIYKRFIDAIKSFDLVWVAALVRRDWRTAASHPDFAFAIPLLAGIVTAVMFFTHIVPLPALLISHPVQIYALFFGLILGSIVVLVVDVPSLRWADGLPFIAGMILGAVIVTAVPTETPDAWWFIMLSGALAICAMVVPGISGSFVLLLLGKYAYVLDAIGHLRLEVAVPFAVGMAAGLMSFTRILSWVLHHFERASLFAISGVLAASLWVIWPFQARQYVEIRGKRRLVESNPVWPDSWADVQNAAWFTLAGLATVLVIHQIARRREDGAS